MGFVKSRGAVLATLVAMYVLTGCSVGSENPVYVPPGAEVDLNPYVGEWHVSSAIGETSQEKPITVTISAGTGGFANAVLTQAGDSQTFPMILADVDGRVVASLQRPNDWKLVGLELSSSELELRITLPNVNVLRADVASGAVSGELIGYDSTTHVVLNEDSTGLRDYLATRPDLFVTSGDEKRIVLTRDGGAQAMSGPNDARVTVAIASAVIFAIGLLSALAWGSSRRKRTPRPPGT